MTYGGANSARRHALQRAAALLDDLVIDQEAPVDVFAAIRRLGAWLTFVPLQHLLGTFVPEGSGGVMITAVRQPAVQRYTAAHEIGHMVLDHNLALDDDDDVFAPTRAERERLAQLFAAYFIMPPPLVFSVASRYGIERGGAISAPQAYLIARDMRVSYEAAVRQMTTLRVISPVQRAGLLRVPPLEAKRALTHGLRPANGYADVWPVDERSNGTRLSVTVDDAVVVALPENRTTGFRWLDKTEMEARGRAETTEPPPPFAEASTEGDLSTRSGGEPGYEVQAAVSGRAARGSVAGGDEPLRRAAELYAPARESTPTTPARRRADRARRIAGEGGQDVPIGGTGRRWLSLEAAEAGESSLQLYYISPYDPDATPVASFQIEAKVLPLPAVENRQQLLSLNLAADSQSDGGGRE